MGRTPHGLQTARWNQNQGESGEMGNTPGELQITTKWEWRPEGDSAAEMHFLAVAYPRFRSFSHPCSDWRYMRLSGQSSHACRNISLAWSQSFMNIASEPRFQQSEACMRVLSSSMALFSRRRDRPLARRLCNRPA